MAPQQGPAERNGVIAIGTSAGGLQALQSVLGALPPSLPTPVVVVQHLSPDRPSHLVELLRRHTQLEVRQAAHGERLRPGVVYVAPPDRHLVVELDGTVGLKRSEKVHFARPSIDELLASVAESCGARGIGVVLTGTGRDGAEGAGVLNARGGTVVVQETETARFPAMPAAVIATGGADMVVPLDDVGATLVELTT